MAPYNTPLSEALKTSDGRTIATLADARAYMLDLPAGSDRTSAWESAIRLVMAAADDPTPEAVEAATFQFRRALFVTYRSEFSARSPASR